MTRKSTTSKKNRKPFLLRPEGKDYLWGGQRLNDDFAKNIPMDPLAETWECSTHRNGESTVASGEFMGRTLTDVLTEHPEFMGPSAVPGHLPILVKFMDAKNWLSVQVHPGDDYAGKYENSLGKTEMWYVLEAKPGATIVFGLDRSATKEEVAAAIEKGTLSDLLHYEPVRKGDVFLIEPGTVHAIGPGLLIAEIQESSDVTYRLYDYDRVDKYGNKRELHVEKALKVANLQVSRNQKKTIRIKNYYPGIDSEFLGRCKYFEVDRLTVNTERHHELATLPIRTETFNVLLCVEGCGVLTMESGESLPIFRGDCLFIPAGTRPLKLHGMMTMIKINC